jgi:membrane-associated phospholipid phosphatase
VLESPDEVRVPPPPEAGSAADERDVRALRAATDGRTEADERRARAIDGQPAVQPWLEDAMQFVAARAKDPPLASRNYALVSVAMYDAVVAAWHWKDRYDREAPDGDLLFAPPADPSYPSEHAAIAGAASRVLEYLYPEEPAPRLERQAEEIASSRVKAGISRPSDVEAGLELGRAVAERVIAYAERDGASRRWDGSRPPHTPAYWDPPPGSAARPVQPLAGTWRTWVLRSGDQFRPPPPPRFGTSAFERQVREVIRVQEDLTAEQKRIASFWAGGEGTPLPPGVWIRVVLKRLRGERMSTPRTARIFALLNIAMADAGVAAWDAKYIYWYPRPENGIRDSGIDPDWKPYIETPFFPAYVSGHSTYSAAAAEVMSYLFPEEAETWHARAREAGISRIYGGIHWPVDNEHGLAMGLRIGRLVVERAEQDGADR